MQRFRKRDGRLQSELHTQEDGRLCYGYDLHFLLYGAAACQLMARLLIFGDSYAEHKACSQGVLGFCVYSHVG